MHSAAIALLALGSAGVIGAVIMEIITKEHIWKIAMKIFPWFFGMGAVLLALSITGG